MRLFRFVRVPTSRRALFPSIFDNSRIRGKPASLGAPLRRLVRGGSHSGGLPIQSPLLFFSAGGQVLNLVSMISRLFFDHFCDSVWIGEYHVVWNPEDSDIRRTRRSRRN